MMATSSETPREFNIVLLGESGNGKSTFINSFANYLKYDTFELARHAEDFSCLIPTAGTITDAEDNEKTFTYGSDPNETLEQVGSGTLSCKSHGFNVGSNRIRLIDSAGIRAAEGIAADERNLDDIFDYICELNNLHAIAIFLMANQNKLDFPFKYCMNQILSKMNRSAAKNIIFVVTSCGQSEIQVLKPLKKYLQKIQANKNIGIELTKNRVYKFDNCAFQYILAEKSKIELPKRKIRYAAEAYEESAEECQRLLKYILGDSTVSGLVPHDVKETKKLKEARNFIKAIHPLIDEILTTIETNQTTYKDQIENQKINCGVEQRYRTMSFQSRRETIEKLNKLKNVIQLEEVKIIPLKDSITVCMSTKCRKEYDINGSTKFLYPQICCKGCYSIGVLSRRLFCEAFVLYTAKCKKCQCHVNEHDLRYFTTEIEKINKNLNPQELSLEPITIETEEQLSVAEKAQKEKDQQQLDSLKNEHDQLIAEKISMENAIKTFDRFLKINSISGSSKTDKAEYEKMVERSRNDDYQRPPVAKRPTSSGENSQSQPTVTAVEILQLRESLFALPKYGARIQQAWSIVVKKKTIEEEEMTKKENFVHVNVKSMAKHFQWLQDNQ